MVFHALHEVHCPVHLGYWVPQFWQKKAVLVLAIQRDVDAPKDMDSGHFLGTFPGFLGQ